MSDKGGKGTGTYGTNTDGNHWCTRGDSVAKGGAYHYSNRDGSYYYQNANGSTYYNDGQGTAKYTTPADNTRTSGTGTGSGANGKSGYY